MSEFNEIMRNAKGREKKYAAFDPNKNKKTIIKLAVAVAIAGICLYLIINWNNLMNDYKFNAMSATNHYLKVEKAYVEELDKKSKGFLDAFDNKKKNDALDRILTARFDATPKLVDILLEKGIKTYGAKNAELTVEYSSTDTEYSSFVSTKINDSSLIDFITYNDKSSGTSYMRIPQVNEAYVQLDDNGDSQGTGVPGVGSIDKATPLIEGSFFEKKIASSREKIEKIEILKDVYFDFVKEKKLVSKARVTEDVNGTTNKFNLYTIELNGDIASDLVLEFLETAKKDDKIKADVVEIATKFENLVGKPMGAPTETNTFETEEPKEEDEQKDDITKHIDYIKEIKDSIKEYPRVVSVKLYTDSDDNVMGHKIELNAETKTSFYFESMKAERNGRIGFTLVLKSKGVEQFNIKGHGLSDLTSVSASSTFTVNDQNKAKKMVKASIEGCDLSHIWNGQFDGKVTISADDIYSGARLVSEIKTNFDDIHISSSVYIGSDNVGALTFDNKNNESPINNKPDGNSKVIKSSDSKAMTKYIQDFDVKRFIKKFSKEAGLTFTYEDLEDFLRKKMMGF
ncbi:MAG TPA: hypothetical protein DCW44_01770 [Eubacterium sp.]|nr:hypothetical protein [Eubacterium sp.]